MATPIVSSFTTCPADCDDDNLLPAIPAIQDCASYDQDRSQVHTLYVMPQVAGVSSADPFTNFATTPTATAAAIDNTTTNNLKAKFVVGEGGVTSTEVKLDYPMNTSKVIEREYTLDMDFKMLTQEMYTFWQQVQCGNIDLTFYYASGMATNQWVFGKQGGIPPKEMSVTFVKGKGKDDRDIVNLKAIWLATGDPDRRINPIA